MVKMVRQFQLKAIVETLILFTMIPSTAENAPKRTIPALCFFTPSDKMRPGQQHEAQHFNEEPVAVGRVQQVPVVVMGNTDELQGKVDIDAHRRALAQADGQAGPGCSRKLRSVLSVRNLAPRVLTTMTMASAA